MTIHDFVRFMQLGEVVKIPSNCTFKELAYYGATRFGYSFRKVGEDSMKRVCPTCGR